MSDVLYPLQHGTLFYTGMTVVPPSVLASADRVDETDYPKVAAALRERMRTLPTIKPIPFRSHDGGDYDENRVLHPEIAPGRSDIDINYLPTDTLRDLPTVEV